MPTQEKPNFGEMLLRTVAVLGLIAVLLLGAWGIIEIAVSIPGFLASIGGRVSSTISSVNKESIAVSAPSNIASGQTLVVSWTHANKDSAAGAYSYSLSYACQSGISLKAPAPNGSYQTVACNTRFNFVNATEHMSVIPSVSSASAPLAITVEAIKLASGSTTASGRANTTVSRAGATAAAAPASTGSTAAKAKVTTAAVDKNTTYTYYPATSVPALYGYGDLSVRILSVVPQGGYIVLQFAVENVGTNSTPGGWIFNANLPINGSYIFNSQPQRALNPGDKIVYTLTFSRPQNNYYTQYQQYPYSYSGGYSYPASGYMCNGYNCTSPSYNQYPTYNQGGSATITVDPYNYVYEFNRGNNFASVAIPTY